MGLGQTFVGIYPLQDVYLGTLYTYHRVCPTLVGIYPLQDVYPGIYTPTKRTPNTEYVQHLYSDNPTLAKSGRMGTNSTVQSSE